MSLSLLFQLLCVGFLSQDVFSSTPNSTYTNPILPGFHPDPSCIFLPEWDNTFFCASSSFLATPGHPIHASKDLVNWKLIGNVLTRPEQLPMLATTSGQTSGLWAPGLRYHNGTFYVASTLVHDDRAQNDSSRWDNMIFSSTNPYNDSTWSNGVHFSHEGYDPTPFWDDDGTVYMVTAHAWQVRYGIDQFTIDLATGQTGPMVNTWNGTGGIAPEGPRLYKKDGYYYLMIAEGGTGLNHQVSIARSTSINGPYISYSGNPLLTNANTTQFFQAVGHADLFQDASGDWWGVALSQRSGPQSLIAPMGRETVLYPASWPNSSWPNVSPVQGTESGPLPPTNTSIPGIGDFVTAGDSISSFPNGSTLPPHFLFWRYPVQSSYTISPPEAPPGSLRLTPSYLNLTGLDASSPNITAKNATAPNSTVVAGQTFVGRRQVDTLFSYSVDMSFTPTTPQSEAGVSLFLTQGHHIDLGVVMSSNGNSSTSLRLHYQNGTTGNDTGSSPSSVVTMPVPASWNSSGLGLTLQIAAVNFTHFAFAAGPVGHQSQMVQVGVARGSIVTWGFTGTLVGVYATVNGGAVGKNGTDYAYVRNWRYQGMGQYLD